MRHFYAKFNESDPRERFLSLSLSLCLCRYFPLPYPASVPTRITKFALRFYPSSPSLPFLAAAYPTMSQPLLIALPHYCPTFMALPLQRSSQPLPSLYDVTYHGHRHVRGVERVLPLSGKCCSCRCTGGAGSATSVAFRRMRMG